ncbi:hypothetical protein NHX12_005013 [Muraenolepis orangiensis]|uniref:Reverse transcriptase domain-containing protein n=1 Tax=Muraenolepis orangiensis TaxID=630683 RepID=A0A9Q0DVK7_9TELE|nr:hypothetical protein NHX12_005013 [Muraenolepis orangiensis]
MKYSRVLIAGDFNFPGIDWSSWTTKSDHNSTEFKFIECIRNCYMHQHVTSPTRGRGTNKPSVLDRVLTDTEEAVEDVDIKSPLSSSDHSTLLIELVCELEPRKRGTARYLYNKADFDSMRADLDIDWEKLLGDNKDIEEQWSTCIDIIQQSMKKHIPQSKCHSSKKKTKNFTTPLDEKALSKLKKKHQLWKRYLNTKNGEIYIEYCRTRNQVRRITRKAIKDFERSIAKQSKSNSKKVWAYVHSKRKTRSGIADLIDLDSLDEAASPTLATTDLARAEVLNRFYSSVFTVEQDDGPIFPPKNLKHPLGQIEIIPEVVKKKLANLNVSKSPGPDGVQPRLLKELNSVLSLPLSIIFNTSLESMKLPEEWKNANVTAIFKKGKRNLPENYRPVSLTSIVCKMMESIIHDFLISHMLRNSLFTDKQYGFISGRSTTLQLITVLDEWTSIIDDWGYIDAIYCDFQKAFDKVPHKRLTHKLEGYGVKVDENSRVYLFADDTKLYRRIDSKDDCDKLHKDLSALQSWSKDWLLKFHPDKCKSMRIGGSSIDNFTYKMGENGEHHLEKVEDEKDIGVVIDEKLTFEKHMFEKIYKANGIMGLIRRTFEYMGPILS